MNLTVSVHCGSIHPPRHAIRVTHRLANAHKLSDLDNVIVHLDFQAFLEQRRIRSSRQTSRRVGVWGFGVAWARLEGKSRLVEQVTQFLLLDIAEDHLKRYRAIEAESITFSKEHAQGKPTRRISPTDPSIEQVVSKEPVVPLSVAFILVYIVAVHDCVRKVRYLIFVALSGSLHGDAADCAYLRNAAGWQFQGRDKIIM